MSIFINQFVNTTLKLIKLFLFITNIKIKVNLIIHLCKTLIMDNLKIRIKAVKILYKIN